MGSIAGIEIYFLNSKSLGPLTGTTYCTQDASTYQI